MNASFLYRRVLCLLLVGLGFSLSGQAQTTATPDSLQAPAAFVPRVTYGLNAGAAVSNFGSVSYVEPRVQYQFAPRMTLFSSLTMTQAWGGPSFRAATAEGSGSSFLAAPSRQYLLHVGGTYAMTEKLLLSGSAWKDLQPSLMNRYDGNPFTFGRYPSQGFQFKAHYQVAPNVTVSGGVRYSNGANQMGYGGYPGAGF